MKTQLEFRSEKFPPYAGEEEIVNPGLWGRRLAEYLVETLAAEGIATKGITPEDWGWVIGIENETFRTWIGCGHQHGDPDEFLCFLQPDRPTLRRWFRRIDTRPHLGRVADALERILSADPDVRDLRWMDVA